MRRFIPSPAMAVAFAALLLALSGSAVAATLISGSRLKNRSVGSKKLKVHSVTGREINRSKLGEVPKARTARFAGSAFSAASAGGLQPKKLDARLPRGTDDTTILDLGGLSLIASCSAAGNPAVRARSNANNAQLKGQVTSSTGTTFLSSDDMDIGSTLGLLGGKQEGQGTVVYTRPDGRIVQLTYAFADAPTEGGFQGCVIAGTGFAG